MKNKIDILHIYAGTSGAAGLYLHEIYLALKNRFEQEVIVSFNYPFSYGKKWFYKNTDLSKLTFNILQNVKIRYMLRFVELIVTLLKTYRLIRKRNVKVVNYSLTTDLLIELLFLRSIKNLRNRILIITCHDVLPFGSEEEKALLKKIEKKKKFFNLANYLLVHNKNSKDDLQKYFNISDNRIVMVPFPVMDLNKLNLDENRSDLKLDNVNFRVGMFGHFRQEKGLDLLIDAWNEIYDSTKDMQLIIAGNIPYNLNYDFNKIENKSSLVIKHYIDDSLLCQLIRKCDVVVMPYFRGTNSGIPSTIISNKSLVVASDIPMFLNNELINETFLFKSGDSYELANKLKMLNGMNEDELRKHHEVNDDLLFKYFRKFELQLNTMFEIIIN